MDEGNQLILLLDTYTLYVVVQGAMAVSGCSCSLMFKPQARAWLGVEKISCNLYSGKEENRNRFYSTCETYLELSLED